MSEDRAGLPTFPGLGGVPMQQEGRKPDQTPEEYVVELTRTLQSMADCLARVAPPLFPVARAALARAEAAVCDAMMALHSVCANCLVHIQHEHRPGSTADE